MGLSEVDLTTVLVEKPLYREHQPSKGYIHNEAFSVGPTCKRHVHWSALRKDNLVSTYLVLAYKKLKHSRPYGVIGCGFIFS